MRTLPPRKELFLGGVSILMVHGSPRRQSEDILPNMKLSEVQEMCEGEILQYSNLYKIPTLEDYLKKTYQKTGSLFEACVLGCVMLSTSQEAENAKEFSKNFGIAFQIRDDIENILKGGNDIKEGVYNAPIIFSGSIDNPVAGIEKSKVLLNNYLDIAQKCLCGMDESEYKSALKKLLELLKYD